MLKSCLRLNIQLSLDQNNLTPITQGVYNAIAEATDSQDQSSSNLNEIARNFRRINLNCTSNNNSRVCVTVVYDKY